MEIFKKDWPDEIPWLGGGCLFIYAPKQYAGDNQVSLGHADQRQH